MLPLHDKVKQLIVMTELFVELIQIAIGKRESLSRIPTDDEWQNLYKESRKQSVGGLAFTALDILSKSGQKPPMALLYEWIGLSEQVRSQNALMNKEAARLTNLFEQEGHNTAILKGQANAILYSQPLTRQPGDIDIWVDGGKEKVMETVRRLGLVTDEIAKYASDGDTTISYHHIHLKKNEEGVDVEVHFRPSSGNKNPFTNKRLQQFLEDEINRENEKTPEGFRVPSVKFALVMQLAHIQRHLMTEGIGLRQVIDYYYLLKSDINNQRDEVKNRLNSFGLKHMSEALMWVLHEWLGLEKRYLIAPEDERRGKMLLQSIVDGGNFGRYYDCNQHGIGQRILTMNKHRLKMFRFDFNEAFWIELDYITFIIKTIPVRISRRRWSLAE